MLSALPINAAQNDASGPWRTLVVPGSWEERGGDRLREYDGYAWYRAWVKVPDHWTPLEGRDLWRESVTLTVDRVGDAHEAFINGTRIGGAGRMPPEFQSGIDGRHRYKVPPGTLIKGAWNEIVIRVYDRDGPGGFLGQAPSIQGYFLECILAGAWEFRTGAGRAWLDRPSGRERARTQKPTTGAFESFHEASRVLGEAAEFMPGARRSPAESFAALEVADGWAVEEVLHEPTVAQPTHLSFDARGRLWVAQYRQYPYPAGLRMISRDKYYRSKYDRVPPPPPHHDPGRARITVHEDTDGDGAYDRHKVFADGLNLANAALHGTGGVWVMQTPYLLFYPDRDADDIPDAYPEVHLQGFGFEDAHSVANGLVWGPDGWIYGAQGSTVTCRVVRPGIDPPGAPGVYFEGCMVWRYHPRSREFELFATGGGNVFGLEFDSEGRLFSGHNGGDTRGWHYVQHGIYLMQGVNPGKFGPPAHPYAFGDLPMMRGGTIPRFSHNIVVCEGTALPPASLGSFLCADPLHHHLVLSERRARGATFETTDRAIPLKSSDPAFRPVYLKNAPDGSIYVADFYERYIAHGQHYQSQIDPSTGRIYRLKGKRAKLIADIDLHSKTGEELIALLDHPNKWHRQTAVRLLAERGGAETAKRLERWIVDHEDRSALDALWALHQLRANSSPVSALGDALSLKALHHPYAGVRSWTIRLLGDARTLSSPVLSAVTRLAATEPNVEVRSQMASTARRLPTDQSLAIVESLLARSEDAADPYVPLLLWWAVEKDCGERADDVLALFANEGLWREPIVLEHLLGRLMRRFAASGRRVDLVACARLLRLAPAEEHRRRLLEGFEAAFAGRPMPPLPDELLAALADAGGLSLTLRVRRGDGDAVAEALRMVSDPGGSLEERIRLVRTFGEVDAPACVEALLDLVRSPGGPAGDALRNAALAALGRYHRAEIGRAVVEVYGALSPETRRTAETLLASRASWSLRFLEAVRDGSLDRGAISRDTLALIRRHGDERLLALADPMLESIEASETAEERLTRVQRIIKSAPGSPYRGRALFTDRCGSCHRLFHKGGHVGPDLTSYQRDDLSALLRAIVRPSDEIREGFENHIVITNDGRTLGGYIADRDDRVIVVRGVDGNDVSLQRAGVVEILPVDRSLMPEGLLDDLSDEQLRDLFAYLRISQPIAR